MSIGIAAGKSSGSGESLKYEDLRKKYGFFLHPGMVVLFSGKDFTKNKVNAIITSCDIEITSDYEASIAKLVIDNIYDVNEGHFVWGSMKDMVSLGASCEIKLGYGGIFTTVFVGFIASVDYIFDGNDVPHVEVTSMDIKGMMMANAYSTSIAAKNFGDAVKQVLEKNIYSTLNNNQVFKDIKYDPTPDAKEGQSQGNEPTRETYEMVAESDYEYVVKVAKKFNFEFFQDKDIVYFRKAKSNDQSLITLCPKDGLITFEIGYSITGLLSSVEVRSMDTGKAEAISSVVKANNKISLGGKAKALIKGSTRTIIDSTVFSKEQAENRANSIMEKAEYRFGVLQCEAIGLPEMSPGRFITIGQLGAPCENDFYITHVRHTFSAKEGYKMHLTGKAKTLKG